MKRLLMVILIIGGVVTGGSYLLTGRLPWVALSEEEQQVIALREAFNQVREQWQAAGRTQALGVDASSQVEAPLASLERIERDLAALTPRLKTTEARNRATVLSREIAAFRTEMR